MFRSAFGVICLVLLGGGGIVPQSLRADTLRLDADRSVEATESGAVNTTLSGHRGILAGSELVESPRPGVRRRSFGGEPSTLLLMGLALLGSAQFARHLSRTNE
jgi:hypothetical protein